MCIRDRDIVILVEGKVIGIESPADLGDLIREDDLADFVLLERYLFRFCSCLLYTSELLVLKIESMTQTWQKPWFYGQGLLPCNITGKRYASTNLLTLLMLTEVKGYRTPVFLTFRQAKERGLTVRKVGS